jgi:hypothetical protein
LTVYIAVVYSSSKENLWWQGEGFDDILVMGRLLTFGGLKGYSGGKWMSKKKTPPS